jgi:hypothetical protein
MDGCTDRRIVGSKLLALGKIQSLWIGFMDLRRAVLLWPVFWAPSTGSKWLGFAVLDHESEESSPVRPE